MRKLYIIMLLTLIVLSAGCTAPPAKNILLHTVTLTGSTTKTVTSPTFTTYTVTKHSTSLTTISYIDVITTTITSSNVSTVTSIITISTSGTVITTKTFTIYTNVYGDGLPNNVSFIIYTPTTKITYTISGTIVLTYTPYYEPYPGVTSIKSHQPVIVAVNSNTTTVYWPNASGTQADVTRFVKDIFRWWDFLYVQAIQKSFISETDPLKFIYYMSAYYYYGTNRAINYSEFYLPHELISTKTGNDGDFAELYAAMDYANGTNATVAILSYGANNRHYVYITNNTIIDANTRLFADFQALANIYNISAQITSIVIGTYQPIRGITTSSITPQEIYFLNTLPNSGMTIVETIVISNSRTITAQFAGSISDGKINFVKLLDLITTVYTTSFVGDTQIVTVWFWGSSSLYTVGTTTFYYAGGVLTYTHNPMEILVPIIFNPDYVTLATVSNNTTIVQGAYYTGSNGVIETLIVFGRTKVLDKEYYYYEIINTKYGYAVTSATGTIYYSPLQ